MTVGVAAARTPRARPRACSPSSRSTRRCARTRARRNERELARGRGDGRGARRGLATPAAALGRRVVGRGPGPAPGRAPGDPELAALAFEDQVAGVDRLRARALALPAPCSPTPPTCGAPIGAAHPLRDRRGRRPARRPPRRPARGRGARGGRAGASLGAAGAAGPPARGPRPGPPRGPADPPAPRRHGEVGRLPHRVRPPRARLRRQRPRARPGGRRGAARRGPAGGEAVASASATSSSTRGGPATIRALIERGERPDGPAAALTQSRMPRTWSDCGVNRLEQLAHQAARPLRTLAGTGRHRGRRGPTAGRGPRSRCSAGARRPPPGYTAPRRSATPTTPAIVDELGTLDLRRGPRAHERARPRAAADGASSAGDGVAIMCRNHRGFVEATSPARSSAPTRCSSTRRSPARSSTDVVEREKPEGDHLRRGVRRGAATTPRSAPQALRRLARRRRQAARTRLLEELIAPATRADLDAAGGAGPRVILTSRHDRHAEGRRAHAARVARPGRRAVLEDPAARRARRR